MKKTDVYSDPQPAARVGLQRVNQKLGFFRRRPSPWTRCLSAPASTTAPYEVQASWRICSGKSSRSSTRAYSRSRSSRLKTPHVATHDIAATAARLLLDKSWTGQGGLGVLGPEDLSCNDIACIMSEVLGKPILFQQIPPDDYKAQFMQNGGSEAMAQGIIDMAADVYQHGIYHAEPRTPENTTPTTFRAWCDQVLKPAVLSAN